MCKIENNEIPYNLRNNNNSNTLKSYLIKLNFRKKNRLKHMKVWHAVLRT